MRNEPTLMIVGPSQRPEGERRGRRPIYGARASGRLAIRLTDEQKKDLREIAQQEDRDLSMVVRDAVDEYVADYRERRVFKTPERYQPE